MHGAVQRSDCSWATTAFSMECLEGEVLVNLEIAVGPHMSELAQRTDSAAFLQRTQCINDAIEEAGGICSQLPTASGLIWLAPDGPHRLRSVLQEHPGISWVQLPWAGVDHFFDAGVFRRGITFTSAKGAFSEQVSEHALMLILACLRNVTAQARHRSWLPTEPGLLRGKRVTIIGAGGIASDLARLLRPAACNITVLRRDHRRCHSARRTLPISELHAVLPGTEILVLALALTAENRHLIGQKELALMPRGTVVVNVARGAHIDTAALVEALGTGQIAAAGLDVTDPEPLPANHPLWAMPNVLITSHSGDSPDYVTNKLAMRVAENVRRLRSGADLVGVVDLVAGY